jgi:hypothetical protein
MICCLYFSACSDAPTVEPSGEDDRTRPVPSPMTTARDDATPVDNTAPPPTFGEGEDPDIIEEEPPALDPAQDGPKGDPCAVAGCGPGQRCETGDAGAACADLTCAALACATTEECQPHDQGGNTCVDVSCEEDVDCAPEQYCSADSLCESDVCTAGARSCDNAALLECASNGGFQVSPYTCDSPSYFATECVALTATKASCSCEDDWDCPAFTTCDVSQCVGTGFAPTCTLPPSSFEDTQPAVEIHWGADSIDDELAHDGSPERGVPPWPLSSHVLATPIVANLDDDNGDGQVNELDFPEIIFTSFEAGRFDVSGVLRAIHGGGPNRGKDYFARCDDQLWTESERIEGVCEGGDARPRSPVGIADLDGDQIPEIIYITQDLGFRVLNNRGELLLDEGDTVPYYEPSVSADGGGGAGGGGRTVERGADVSIANLDEQLLPELVFGGTVFTLGLDMMGNLFIEHRLEGRFTQGFNTNFEPMSCVADMHPNPGQELLAGGTLYAMPQTLPVCAAPPCTSELEVLWSAAAVNDGASAEIEVWDGFCAVADVWGADQATPPGPSNPPDRLPEAILIIDGKLVILDAATGTLIESRDLGGGDIGGAPNVDDFDGDGFMEIASALADFYVVIDLQQPDAACPAWPIPLPIDVQADQADNPNIIDGQVRDPGGAGAMTLASGAVQPGTCAVDTDCAAGAVCNEQAQTCVCLHNGWSRNSDDDSSRATSSSVFDFNGDGAAEVLYNDECFFRVYNGVTGSVLYSEISRSRTFTENPVVADVDNDGNAEVVTTVNTEGTDRCDDDGGEGEQGAGPNGIRVWGDPQDTWVAARRIWNQQSYHVTNITEGGTVPTHAPESWGEFNGRTYNTYRSQPRQFGVAPDLSVIAVSVFSPDADCGALNDVIQIVFEVYNGGDIRVGPGVQVSFFGTWAGVEEALTDAVGTPLTVTLNTSIEPGRSVIQSITFDQANQATQGELPENVRVEVDSGGAADSDFGAERECNEDNNDLSEEIDPGEPRPDLTLELGEATVDCTTNIASVSVTVINSGTAAASGVVVRLYAGEPAQGGAQMAEITLGETIEPMSELSVQIEIPNLPDNREITLWGWVDPLNAVDECDESDNSDPAENSIECIVRKMAR